MAAEHVDYRTVIHCGELGLILLLPIMNIFETMFYSLESSNFSFVFAHKLSFD